MNNLTVPEQTAVSIAENVKELGKSVSTCCETVAKESASVKKAVSNNYVKIIETAEIPDDIRMMTIKHMFSMDKKELICKNICYGIIIIGSLYIVDRALQHYSEKKCA